MRTIVILYTHSGGSMPPLFNVPMQNHPATGSAADRYAPHHGTILEHLQHPEHGDKR